MSQLLSIGLSNEYIQEVSPKLQVILSEYSVFYQNLRGLHWNIQGEKFFELHEKFEELYNEVQIKIDEIAERLLTLGVNPTHRFTDYIKQSSIGETPMITNGIEGVKHLVHGLGILIALQREVLGLAGDHDDEGTGAMMSDNIREHEKLAWMYNAFLS